MKPLDGRWCADSTARSLSLAGRKIGCDREQPHCRNCLRTGRKCLGYSIRLIWPDRPDGRRRKLRTVSPHETDLLPAWTAPAPDFYGTQFLNVTLQDLAAALPNRPLTQSIHLMPPLAPRPGRTMPLSEWSRLSEDQLLNYCKPSGRGCCDTLCQISCHRDIYDCV